MTDSTTALGTVSATGFRALMSEFPSGIAIVTATDDEGGPWGMTCSSLCSLSVSPPMLLVCLRAGSPTLAAIVKRGAFAVNLLHDGARSAAELFASGRPGRFDQVRWNNGQSGPHLLDAAHAIADCRVSRTEHAGSHVIVMGTVLDVTHQDGHVPLLYGRRRYSSWPE
ncbi:flavin reductase family protein [Lentzea sp. E54]|uniref:flavin reductase family protein n=1 Tax=Lentzea xerophila TaxID=3435883 RepID=UPI003DA5346E